MRGACAKPRSKNRTVDPNILRDTIRRVVEAAPSGQYCVVRVGCCAGRWGPIATSIF